MPAEDYEDFEVADAGSSDTFPMQCSALRKGGHVMMNGRPCKVSEMSTSKTGKHGHAKVRVTGFDIFTGKKYEDINPSTHNVSVPRVTRKDFQLINVADDGYLGLMDDAGNTRENLKAPENEVGEEIKKCFAADKDISVTVLAACGEECVVSIKNNTQTEKNE